MARQKPRGRGGGGGRGGVGGEGKEDAPAAVKVELSAMAEAKARKALRDLAVATPVASRRWDAAFARAVLADVTEAKLRRAYDDLLARGFAASDVEDALTAVVDELGSARAHASAVSDPETTRFVSASAALDWLCFHLPTERLPRRYQGAARVAADATGADAEALEVFRAEDRGVADAGDDDASASRGDEADAEARRRAREADAEARRAREAAAEADRRERLRSEAESAARANREWIMRQYEEGSGSGSASDEGSSEGSSHDSLEDFGLDPEEVARRARVRRRARAYATDPAAHVAVMRAERDAARGEASRAKAARDKKAQRAAGDALKRVLDEAAAYGLRPEDLDAPPREEDEDEDEEQEEEEGKGEASMGASAGVSGGLEASVANLAIDEGPPQASSSSSSSSSSDEEGFGVDLFDLGDDAETAAILGDGTRTHPEPVAIREAPLFPPGTIEDATRAGRKEKGGLKSSSVQKTPPKALLQMLCRREGWIAPRYEKDASAVASRDGERSGAGGAEYSVVVERSGGGRKIVGGADKRAAAASTVRASSRAAAASEEEAGTEGVRAWASVNEAQCAAAARALFETVGVEEGKGGDYSFTMPSELPDEYRRAWRRWAEAEAARRERLRADGAAGESARDAFARRALESVRERAAGASEASEPRERRGPADEDEDASMTPSPRAPARSSSEAEARRKRAARVSAELQASEAAKRKEGDAAWAKMRAFRETLPVAKLRASLIAALDAHDACVVCGETGSGKTTQVPQYLLDDAIDRGAGSSCRIVCTQPRRVAALTVAERVAAERCERRGVGARGSLVGHHVRLDAAVCEDTRLTFMTAGILLRKMHGDAMLEDVSHVVLDEIHERSLDGDFLLALLKTLPERRRRAGAPPLKLVVMSATLDAELFRGYLRDCPVVSAPGRTHPVVTRYLEEIHDELGYGLDEDSRCCRRPLGGDGRGAAELTSAMRRDRKALVLDQWGVDASAYRGDENPEYEAEWFEDCTPLTRRNLSRLDESVIDYDLIEALLVRVDETEGDGAVLIFLPGVGEVSSLIDRLRANPAFAPRLDKHRVLPLHSALSPQEQRECFKVPPRGVRKIVVATNVAETSVTIEDVVVVIDSGRVKERQWDPRKKMASLEEAFVSKAAARQRAGRAGRVRPGTCYALFTRRRATVSMRAHQVPELRRVPLTEVALQIKKLSPNGAGSVAGFLARALEPPNPEAVAAAVATLREIGAVEGSEEEEEEAGGGFAADPGGLFASGSISAPGPAPSPPGGCDSGRLTPLGHHLAALPVDCRVAKMLVYGAMLSCLSPTLTIAACLSYKSPFLDARSRGGERGEASKRRLSLPASGGLEGGEQSDHLAVADAYDRWAKAVKAEGGDVSASSSSSRGAHARCAAKLGLCPETLKHVAEMRAQYASLLADIGFLDDDAADASPGSRARRRSRGGGDPLGWADAPEAAWNADAASPRVVKAVLCAGLYANVAALGGEGKWRDVAGEVAPHPSSVLGSGGGGSAPRAPFLAFHEKVKTSRVFVRDATVLPPEALLLFGGRMDVRHETQRVCLDGWLWLRASAQTAVLFKKLRAALDDALDAKIRTRRGGREIGGEAPETMDERRRRGEEIVRVVRAVLR